MTRKLKFVTEATAARQFGRRGWLKLTTDEAGKKGEDQVPLRRVDSGNLARCATALEKVAVNLGRIALAAERSEQKQEAP